MKKLLNVLYVTKPEYYLRKEGLNVVVSLEGKRVARYPVHILRQIVCFNYMGASPDLMQLCMEENVPISFLHPMENIAGESSAHHTAIFTLAKNNMKWLHPTSPSIS